MFGQAEALASTDDRTASDDIRWQRASLDFGIGAWGEEAATNTTTTTTGDDENDNSRNNDNNDSNDNCSSHST